LMVTFCRASSSTALSNPTTFTLPDWTTTVVSSPFRLTWNDVPNTVTVTSPDWITKGFSRSGATSKNTDPLCSSTARFCWNNPRENRNDAYLLSVMIDPSDNVSVLT